MMISNAELMIEQLDNNTTVPCYKSPIIHKRHARCRRLLQQIPVTTIPETPDDIASQCSEVTVAAVTAANFAAAAERSPQEGALAEQEATLPFSDATFCSALEPEWSTHLNFKPEESVFIDENSNATYCSDIENLDNNGTPTIEPAPLFETRNSLQNAGTLIELFDSATANDSQAEGNFTNENNFLDETIDTQQSENSSQNLTNQKSSKNSFEHLNRTCSQPQNVKKPSVLNKWRKGRGKRRKPVQKNVATEPDTPPDSGSLVSFDSPPFYSSLPTENERHSRDQSLLSSTQNPCSQNNSFKGQAKCLVKQVRAIRNAVDDWVITKEGLGDPVETRKIIESIRREAQALSREADGPVKIELEHVLQACEYITLQLQYVPYHSTKAENSVDKCKSKRKCEDLTFHSQQEDQTDDQPSLKEMLASTAIRPGHCNLTLNIGDEVVEKGSLDSKGHIYARKGKVYLSAEAWYRESMPRKTTVTRHEAYKNILYRGVPLLFFCKINSSTKTFDHLPNRKSSGRDESMELEELDIENQEMDISYEQQEIPSARQMKENLSKKLTSNITFPESSTATYFSTMPEIHNDDNEIQKEDSSEVLGDDLKNDEPSNSNLASATTFLTNLQRKSKERQLTCMQKCNFWLGGEPTPDVPIIPELQKMDETSGLHLQDSNFMLPVNKLPIETTVIPLVKIKSSVTKEQAMIQSLLDSLDNELTPVRSYHEPLAINPKIFRELPEESGLSEKTLALNQWHERLMEWKSNPNSQLRQSRGLKSTYSSKHHANESGTTLLKTLSEKVRILEENFSELKRSTDEIKSIGSRQVVDTVSCQQCQGSVKKSCDNSSSKNNKDRPKVSTPRHVVNKSYYHTSNSQPEPSTSHSQPLFNSAEKLHGNKLETVKRNLGSWFSSTSRIGQKLQRNKLLNQEINVDKSNTK
ncbi:hypothetical protein B566_EDAN001656 [Ephemera danica]|nr:hypothetical protein B566_EDAN001656 [Ephemera danica]